MTPNLKVQLPLKLKKDFQEGFSLKNVKPPPLADEPHHYQLILPGFKPVCEEYQICSNCPFNKFSDQRFWPPERRNVDITDWYTIATGCRLWVHLILEGKPIHFNYTGLQLVLTDSTEAFQEIENFMEKTKKLIEWI